MPIDWNLVVFLLPFIALAAALAALVFSVAMHMRVSRIFRSANTPDIERLLKLHTRTIEDLLRFHSESVLEIKHLSDRIKKKVASVPTLRFNPFQGDGAGGNQSFSSVFADEEGNGLVVTSIHTRERTNVFAKPLKNWQSEHELSDEEKRVVQISAGDKAVKSNGPEK